MLLKSERTELLLVSASSLPPSRPACMKLLAILVVEWSPNLFVCLFFNQRFNPGQKKCFPQSLLLNRKEVFVLSDFYFFRPKKKKKKTLKE